MEFPISSLECRMQLLNAIVCLKIQRLHLISFAETNCLPKLQKEIVPKNKFIAKKRFFTYTKDFPFFRLIPKISFFMAFFPVRQIMGSFLLSEGRFVITEQY